MNKILLITQNKSKLDIRPSKEVIVLNIPIRLLKEDILEALDGNTAGNRLEIEEAVLDFLQNDIGDNINDYIDSEIGAPLLDYVEQAMFICNECEYLSRNDERVDNMCEDCNVNLKYGDE